MIRPLRTVVVAVLTAVVLTGCTSEPDPDPEAFWTELSFYTDLPDDYRTRAITEAQAVCARLAGDQPSEQDEADSLAALWGAWVDEMGPADAGFFWETAVEHLCPDQVSTLERVRTPHDGAADSAP